MRRKEFMNVNEERLKEIMAHETDADGCPKTHPDGIEKEEDRGKEGKESVSIPDGRTEKPTVFHKPAVRSGTSLAERMKTYRADYLSRRSTSTASRPISVMRPTADWHAYSPCSARHDRTGIP